MRILFLGAGATGGYFGGRLARAGADVTFLVRPKRREQLARDGLRIESPLGGVATPVAAVTHDEITAPFDAIVLSAKAYDLAAAIDAITPAVGERTLVLPILNGMRHLDDLDHAFGKARVLGGMCQISADVADDGTIRHFSPFASITLGARLDEQKAACTGLRDELARGFDASIPDDVIAAMWGKWFFIATLAAATCLMRATVGEIVTTEGGLRFITDVLDEALAVATANGYPPEEATISLVRRLLTDPKSNFSASMLRDIQRRGKIEAGQIVGDLIRRGREFGVAMPMLETAYAHLQAYQNRIDAEPAALG